MFPSFIRSSSHFFNRSHPKDVLVRPIVFKQRRFLWNVSKLTQSISRLRHLIYQWNINWIIFSLLMTISPPILIKIQLLITALGLCIVYIAPTNKLDLWWIIAAIDLMTSVFDVSQNVNRVITLSISATPKNQLGLGLCHSLRQDILRLPLAFLWHICFLYNLGWGLSHYLRSVILWLPHACVCTLHCWGVVHYLHNFI